MKALPVLAIAAVLVTAILPGIILVPPARAQASAVFMDDFTLYEVGLVNRGSNPFFSLNPGYQLVLEDTEGTRLVITVLKQTVTILGVSCRVVEERESVNGVLIEVSRNFFAISNVNNSCFYFGEDVDFFDEEGNIISHEGSWRAGENGAREGLIMPGIVIIGARHFQEVAPDVALDRAEYISVTETVQVPFALFEDCIEVEETSPLEPGARDTKFYAPGVGLIKDADLELVSVSGKF